MANGDATISCQAAAHHYAQCYALCGQFQQLDNPERLYEVRGRAEVDEMHRSAENKVKAQHLVRVGMEQMQARDFDKALATMDEALRLDPHSVSIKALRDECKRHAQALEQQYQVRRPLRPFWRPF